MELVKGVIIQSNSHSWLNKNSYFLGTSHYLISGGVGEKNIERGDWIMTPPPLFEIDRRPPQSYENLNDDPPNRS